MFALGHKWTLHEVQITSGLPLHADICDRLESLLGANHGCCQKRGRLFA
jgi:hypothetical protein